MKYIFLILVSLLLYFAQFFQTGSLVKSFKKKHPNVNDEIVAWVYLLIEVAFLIWLVVVIHFCISKALNQIEEELRNKISIAMVLKANDGQNKKEGKKFMN